MRSNIIFVFSLLALFATPIFSFAQTRCPNRDCVFPLRAQGLNEALGVLGQRAGNVRLQTAVYEQGPKPIMVSDDSGRPPYCAWNCDQQGETGQARLWDVKVNGADERLLPSATSFTEAEKKRFSGIGRTECPTSRSTTYISTAFHVGSYGTMVTTAHSFVDPVTNAKIPPNTCRVAFYNYDGTLRETVAISYVKSRWDEPGKFGDTSNDLAIIKLEGDSKTPSDMPYAIVPDRLTTSTRVSVIGFSLDIAGKTVIKRVYGAAIQPRNTEIIKAAALSANEPLNNPENTAITSYDSKHGTSGSPVLDSRGDIIGVHQGSQGTNGAEYNQTNSYNRAVIFDKRFITDLNAVIARSSSI
ncbi:MAG: trypsin-like peptidase domain-containing protein [Alphaproteobacteria bacterium]